MDLLAAAAAVRVLRGGHRHSNAARQQMDACKITMDASSAPLSRLAAVCCLLLLVVIAESCLPSLNCLRNPTGHIDFSFAVFDQERMCLRRTDNEQEKMNGGSA